MVLVRNLPNERCEMVTACELQQREANWGAQNYASLPVVLNKALGSEVWDVEGNRYLDFMGAYSASNLGHCHPRIVSALIRQAQTLDVISRAFYSDKLGALLEKSCRLFGFEKALPMNTGAEAVETAIKAARKWAYKVKGVLDDKAEIVCCTNNFHGRTLGAVSMSSCQKTRNGFGPFTPGFKVIPFNDVDALSNAINKHTAAFIVEPIQGEAGIIVPSQHYLEKCAAICRENRVLLITDEIQTGLGRGGHLLASMAFNVLPDATVIGKSLGGGMVPVSMMLGRKEIMDVFLPGDHGSTFGGYPIAATVAYEALSIIEDEQLCKLARDTGIYLKSTLESVESKHIKCVRGVGLMLAVECNPETLSAHQLVKRLLSRGILCKNVNEKVIRLAPPLAINHDQIQEFIDAFKDAITDA